MSKIKFYTPETNKPEFKIKKVKNMTLVYNYIENKFYVDVFDTYSGKTIRNKSNINYLNMFEFRLLKNEHFYERD